VGYKITGIGKTEDFFYEISPEMKKAKSVGMGVVDLEALAELHPDIFIHKSSDRKTLDRVSDIGIPAIGIDVESPKAMMIAIKILGKVLGKEKRAKTLTSFYKNEIDQAMSITGKLGDERTLELEKEKANNGERPKAIIMGSSIGKVADGHMIQSKMIGYAGGKNPAEEIKVTELWPTVGVEQIIKWNPEYIFITGSESANYSPDDLFKDTAWKEITAIKNKNVFVIPSQGKEKNAEKLPVPRFSDSWELPGLANLLAINYMTYKMHPNAMSKKKLDKKIKNFYETCY
ncbi:MAG: ABC transporter substrate-binding protein, partial [Anaerovoracaceae bacterium]